MGPGMGSILGPLCLCCTTYRPPLLKPRTVRAQRSKSHLVRRTLATQHQGVNGFFVIVVPHFNFEFRPRFWTYESQKSGPVFEAYSIYIIIYVVESNLGPKIAFLSQNLVQVSLFVLFCFWKILFCLQGEWDFQKYWREKEDNNYNFLSQNLV